MAAYVITDVEITDSVLFRPLPPSSALFRPLPPSSALYGEFLEKVTATVESNGGKFVARGGAIDVIVGDWMPTRVTLLKFGSVEQVNTWLSSPKYTALDEIRTKSSNINMVVVEGL